VDAEYSAVEKDEVLDPRRMVTPGDLRRMSRRLGETLRPALDALNAFRSEIGDEADVIIKDHFESVYRMVLPGDSRFEHVGRVDPISLLEELASVARRQKEAEKRNRLRFEV